MWRGACRSLAATPDLNPHPRILSFPRNLLSPSETRRGLATAFRMWSDVSPFSFREVAPEQPSDLRIGGHRAPAPAQPCGPLSAPVLPQASTRSTTRTAWSLPCTTALTARQASWPTPSSPRTGASTSMTVNTGSWAPRATAGRKVMAWPPVGPSAPRWAQQEGFGGGGYDLGSSKQEGGGWEEATGLGSRSPETPPAPPPPCCWRQNRSYIPGGRAHCLCWPGTFLSSHGCAE